MMRRNSRGFVLLEVLVALIVLSLVGLAYLQLFRQAHRLSGSSREWMQAVELADDVMEQAKLGKEPLGTPALQQARSGFQQRIERHAWQDGFDLVTVTVTLPGGGHVELQRLVRPGDPGTTSVRW
jgi:prepilin-type N-terminal cleavage/methylation domain-containing protein